MTETQLHSSWNNILKNEFKKNYMLALKAFIRKQKQAGMTVYPKKNQIFNALNSTPFDQVKVVILGQDPYHGPHQAHGLCFSVKEDTAIPPSLRNVFKELNQDTGFIIPQHGCLQPWAEQGVLLLNSVLTVNQAQANSHKGMGWEIFTDKIINALNQQHNNLVYMLWGAYAQKKGKNINATNNLILQSIHPSPLSAHRGFLGNHHFSQCNAYLIQQNKKPIQWNL